MTNKRIVDISEIEKLFNRFTTPTQRLETIMQYIDQATPVSGEAVAMINFNEHEEYICMPVGREVFKLAPDVDHLLYTTPQPTPDTVPVEKYNRAIDALKCIDEDLVNSVNYILVKEALAEAMKGE